MWKTMVLCTKLWSFDLQRGKTHYRVPNINELDNHGKKYGKIIEVFEQWYYGKTMVRWKIWYYYENYIELWFTTENTMVLWGKTMVHGKKTIIL